jgi:hypothetical protein
MQYTAYTGICALTPDIAPARLDVTHIDGQLVILYLLGASYLYIIFKRTIR